MDSIRDVKRSDIDHVAAHMRDSDVLTLISSYPSMTTYEALEFGVKVSTSAWTYTIDDEPVAIYGVSPLSLLADIGSPWLLATDLAFRRPRALVKYGKEYSMRMLALYPHLLNYVDSRDTRAVRWLKHIGYTVHEPEPYGADGSLFHKFEMKSCALR